MIRYVSLKLGKTALSLTEFCKSAGISYRPIHRVFGDWNTALQKAGLRKHPAHKLKIPDEELFDEYFKVTEALTRFPSYHEFARRSKYSIGVYDHRFGNFTEFRKHAIQYGIDKGLITPEIAQPTIENLQAKPTHKEHSYKPLEDRPVLGERIDFPGLFHAPVNELGVVYLFGILSDKLGFEVDSIQSGFPDCEAKRKLKNNRWQSVRIEFEYRSSNFIEHGHDITKCDLIICWEHDWNDCPLEVISLKEYIKTHK
jgi:hypothetical protein